MEQMFHFKTKKLSSDTSSSSDALKHAIKFMEKLYNTKYDFIIEIIQIL